MRFPLLRGRVPSFVIGRLCLIAILAGFAGAQAVFNFAPGGFTGANVCGNSAPTASCQVRTNGTPALPTVQPGGVLRLNDAIANQHASAWYYQAQPLTTGFTTAFQFKINGSGDGLAFVIQGDPAGTAAIGYTADGHNISYGNADVSTASGPNAAITNSLAVELDTYMNAEYGDPDANHIAIQSCGPNNNQVLSPNSADHGYLCASGQPAKLGLASLSGVSLADGNAHTITVNYLPPGTCTAACNNFSVYLDSTLVLQITLDLAQQIFMPNNSAYLGFTSATGAAVETNDILSWSYSQLPLAPITITQPIQTTDTTFNYTSTLSSGVDYSQSLLPPTTFQGVFMQSTVQAITDQQFTDLVNNTPFQGSSCLHQDLGQGTYACVTTTDLCTNSVSSTPSGANCPGTLTALIGTTAVFNADPSQKPITAPAYLMGKDTALSCGAAADNTCKGLSNMFTGIVGDPTVSGKTKNFNSVLIPAIGVVQPSTTATVVPALNGGWTNGPVAVNFQSSEVVPGNNLNPPSSLPTVTGIGYSLALPGVLTPTTGTIAGPTGSLPIPVMAEGVYTLTYAATDSSQTTEAIITNLPDKTVSTASPTLTIKVDKTAPTLTCTPPAPMWQAGDVLVPCSASDNPTGSGLANPAQANFSVATAVPAGTETNTATIPAVTAFDVAGNPATQGPFGPFLVDKKAPVITGVTITPSNPSVGQTVTATYTCSDGGSGVVLCGPAGSGLIPATATTGTLSSVVDGSAGMHVFTVTSRDAVGNLSTPVSVSYTVSNAAQLSISPSTIAFGNVKKFSINARIITVKNTGTAQVNFSGINLTQTESDGGPGREFVMINLCGSKLLPGKSCYVTIGFLADEVVSAAGTVTFTDNAQGSPQQVQITGNVVKR